MDYLEFYDLKEHPFSNVVDNRFYYHSGQLSNSLEKLRYAIDSKRGLVAVVGDIGTGKTTLARRLLEELDEDTYEATLLVIVHSTVSSEWMLKKLAMLLGVDKVENDKIKILSQIHKRLIQINDEGKKAVILIDEVQMLNSREIMEEFRGLLNMELSNGKLVNFIFFGLNELEKVLSLDEPLKQRVALKLNLKSLSEENSDQYIHHRLKVASCGREVFTKKAIHEIYKYSRGTPRLINTICDNALLEGFLMKKELIDEETIKTVATDLGLASS